MNKKKRPIKKRQCFKSRWISRDSGLGNGVLKGDNLSLAHPVVKASYVWSIVCDQLSDILGPEVHHQWFKNVRPTVISQNVLILEVPNHFSAQWIHTHYHELVDILLSVMDKRLSSFFISQSERHHAPKVSHSLESPTPEVKRQCEDQDS